eukprot:scaffold2134_cov147-Skeletonema_menzelii.AAC.1
MPIDAQLLLTDKKSRRHADATNCRICMGSPVGSGVGHWVGCGQREGERGRAAGSQNPRFAANYYTANSANVCRVIKLYYILLGLGMIVWVHVIFTLREW